MMNQRSTWMLSLHRARWLPVLGLAALVACDDSTGPTMGDEPAVNVQRLLVTDGANPTARLIALHNDSVVQSYTLAERPHRVYATASGRYAGIVLRDANRVHFVDGGVWTDGAHGHRRQAEMLRFELTDQRPTYENVNGDWLAVFFDGSGMGRWMRESEMMGGNPRTVFEMNTGRPHHGAAITVLANGVPFFATSTPNADARPTGVQVRNQQGQVVSEVPVGECPGVHGNTSSGGIGVVGCNNGMVLIRGSGGNAVAQKVTLSGDMAGLAMRNAYTAPGADFILGQFAAFPGEPAQRVLATIDAAGNIQRMPALPAGVTDHWRVVEPIRGQIVILGNDGALYIYNSARQLQHTITGVVPTIPAGSMPHQIAVAEGVAAVPSPTTGEIVLVNLGTGSVIRRANLGGAPSRLVLLGAQAGGSYSMRP